MRIHPALTPAQAYREEFRSMLFSQRGCADASTWASRLTVRDAEKDDRRICLECANLQKSGRCSQTSKMRGVSPRHEPVTTILQRCHLFAWQLPE